MVIISPSSPSEHHGFELFDTQQELRDDRIFLCAFPFQTCTPFLEFRHALLPLRFQQTIIPPLDHPPFNLRLRQLLHVASVGGTLTSTSDPWLPYAYCATSNLYDISSIDCEDGCRSDEE